MKKNEMILRVKNVTKSFPGVKALKGVNLDIYSGEVHALLGENGAGKSTLMKIILGMYQPTSGEMEYKGEKYMPRTPMTALNMGISMIHQEINLVPTTSVAENVWIGREYRFGNRYFINKQKQEKATEEILGRLGLEISPSTSVSALSIAERPLSIFPINSMKFSISVTEPPYSGMGNISGKE